MEEVTLNDAEQKLTIYLAKKRYLAARAINAPLNTFYGDRDPWQAEIESFGAEVAFCKLHNCYPEFDPNRFSPIDAILKSGLTVDVKCTARENGRMLVKVKVRDVLPDLYALMVGTFPVFKFIGYCKSEDILRDDRIDRSLPHPAYTMDQSELFLDGEE